MPSQSIEGQAMLNAAIAHRHTVPDTIRASVIRNADTLEVCCGIVGLLFHAVCFSWIGMAHMWAAYMLMFLVLGFLLLMVRDAVRSSLDNADFDDEGHYAGHQSGSVLLMTVLQGLASFFLVGIYGILIAAIVHSFF